MDEPGQGSDHEFLGLLLTLLGRGDNIVCFTGEDQTQGSQAQTRPDPRLGDHSLLCHIVRAPVPP